MRAAAEAEAAAAAAGLSTLPLIAALPVSAGLSVAELFSPLQMEKTF